MPDCNHRPVFGPFVKGRAMTIHLDPPLGPTCRFEVRANGLPATVGDHGGYVLHAVGADGAVTITPTRHGPWGTIELSITCDDCTQTLRCVLPGGERPPEPVRRPGRRRRRRLRVRVGLLTVEVG